ncbi:MAG TPA: SURF1 family protein, partial [Candidatus Sulfotelmatobacter sp.]|nr:SURF1 family protein [Candidatus Sulfotelmatobacter sp.]
MAALWPSSVRPAFWPTLFTVPALILLVGLGIWQLERLAWKTDLLATVDSRIHAAPVPLPPGDAIDPKAWEWRHVTVSGHFLNDKEMHLLAYTERGNLGYHLIVPLARDGGGFVLVDRGWVPAANKRPETRPLSQPSGGVTVTGVVRTGWRQGWFVPDNQPAQNLWFFADIPGFIRQAGIAAPALLVEAGPAPNPGGLPIGGQTVVDIPNDHL